MVRRYEVAGPRRCRSWRRHRERDRCLEFLIEGDSPRRRPPTLTIRCFAESCRLSAPARGGLGAVAALTGRCPPVSPGMADPRRFSARRGDGARSRIACRVARASSSSTATRSMPANHEHVQSRSCTCTPPRNGARSRRVSRSGALEADIRLPRIAPDYAGIAATSRAALVRDPHPNSARRSGSRP